MESLIFFALILLITYQVWTKRNKINSQEILCLYETIKKYWPFINIHKSCYLWSSKYITPGNYFLKLLTEYWTEILTNFTGKRKIMFFFIWNTMILTSYIYVYHIFFWFPVGQDFWVKLTFNCTASSKQTTASRLFV